jgi:hypothetical protein
MNIYNGGYHGDVYGDEGYGYEGPQWEEPGMSSGVKAVIVLGLIVVLATIIIVILYFTTNVFGNKNTNTNTNTNTTTPHVYPEGCNFQESGTFGEMLCPPGFTTEYNHGYNSLLDCNTTNNKCNRCYTFDLGYPEPNPGYTEWPNRDWRVFTGDRDSPGPQVSGGQIMGYSDGLYATEGLKIPTTGICSKPYKE